MAVHIQLLSSKGNCLKKTYYKTIRRAAIYFEIPFLLVYNSQYQTVLPIWGIYHQFLDFLNDLKDDQNLAIFSKLVIF